MLNTWVLIYQGHIEHFLGYIVFVNCYSQEGWFLFTGAFRWHHIYPNDRSQKMYPNLQYLSPDIPTGPYRTMQMSTVRPEIKPSIVKVIIILSGMSEYFNGPLPTPNMFKLLLAMVSFIPYILLWFLILKNHCNKKESLLHANFLKNWQNYHWLTSF